MPASTPVPVCFQVVDSEAGREEFQTTTGIVVNHSTKAAKDYRKLLVRADAELSKFEREVDKVLSREAKNLCPFKRLEALANDNAEIRFGERNIGRVETIMPLRLNKETGGVFFPAGRGVKAGREILKPQSLFCVEISFRQGENTHCYGLHQSACTGLKRIKPKGK